MTRRIASLAAVLLLVACSTIGPILCDLAERAQQVVDWWASGVAGLEERVDDAQAQVDAFCGDFQNDACATAESALATAQEALSLARARLASAQALLDEALAACDRRAHPRASDLEARIAEMEAEIEGLK